MKRKLYRSREDRMIAGVCGGIAEYFDLDPTMIRLAAAILLIVTNLPIFIAYIICAVVIPVGHNGMNYYEDDYTDYSHYGNDDTDYSYNENQVDEFQKKKNNQRLLGIGMMIVGGIMLFDIHLSWISTSAFWSLAIIGCGGLILLNSSKREENI